MVQTLEGKVFIVTGASRGIGLAASVALAKRGARVALFGRDTSALADAESRLAGAGLAYAFDIADRETLVATIDQATADFGRLDGIVNNAGLSLASPIEALDPAEVATQVNVNFLATVYACQAAIPHLRRQGGGHIINVTPASARHMDEFAFLAIYSSTKAAVERFTVELREEVKADNIAATIFSPGGTETAFGTGWRPEAAGKAFEAWLAKAAKFDGTMSSDAVGEAIARCAEAPPGTAFDFVELRPNRPTSRRAYAETLYAARSANR